MHPARNQLSFMWATGAFTAFICATVFSAPADAVGTVYNVKQYGVKGNGTDEQAAIQNVLTMASAQPGSSVYFPPGNYAHSSSLTASGIVIFGKNATLTGTTTTEALNLSGTGVTVQTMNFSGVANGDPAVVFNSATRYGVAGCTFTGFAVDVETIDSTVGFIVANKFTVDNGIGLELSNSNLTTVIQNAFVETGGPNKLSLISVGSGQNTNILANSFTGAHAGVLSARTQTLSFKSNTSSNCESLYRSFNDHNVTITSNVATGAEGLLFSQSTNSVIDNNVFGKNVPSFGIELNLCSTAQITNNQINSSSGAQAAGILLFDSSNVSIERNNIKGGGGVLGESASTNPVSSVTIKNNKFHDLQFGIQLVPFPGIPGLGWSSAVVSNNTISNIQLNAILFQSPVTSYIAKGNQMKNCGMGLTSGNFQAVMYDDPSSVTKLVIKNNSYTGSTTGLKYFIQSTVGTPPLVLEGNTTNTGLGNSIP